MKDIAAPLGIGAALGVIMLANILEGGSPASLFLLPPLLLVFGGTLCVAVAGGTVADAKNAVASVKRALFGKVATSADVVPVVVSLSDAARREGMLALESRVEEIDDPFLVKGVTLAVDGTDPEELREILEGELHAKKAVDKHSAKFFTDAGGYAPTIGIVGTVMSLVHVLENLADPGALGHSIAAAFLATLWGVLSANVLWLPIAARLKRLSELECNRMELVIEGIAAIQAGANPRIVAQKLQSLLPPQEQLEAAA
ncbi:chemotaxis protein MotA [Nocardioides sp. J9]|uniref:motility protein A n=1 Tax=unclassified Nocardioides TaxID=2615069 RepID=UPI0004AFE930|nr:MULTISPECIES: MotA/TolQ/ExbB proton channel family protein [unclassified Nocardioides]TWG98614.1 chemotaxis protein MotA [Nocardioides sp. J9]